MNTLQVAASLATKQTTAAFMCRSSPGRGFRRPPPWESSEMQKVVNIQQSVQSLLNRFLWPARSVYEQAFIRQDIFTIDKSISIGMVY